LLWQQDLSPWGLSSQHETSLYWRVHGWKNHRLQSPAQIEGLGGGGPKQKDPSRTPRGNSAEHPRTPRPAETRRLKEFGSVRSPANRARKEEAGSASSRESGPTKLMTSAVSGRFPNKASGLLVWPPPERGIHIAICESPVASYSVVVGLSQRALEAPRPRIYFRPERRAKGRPFGEPCGEAERLTLFRGLDSAARQDAERIFHRICTQLRALSATEGGV
jgi:hypothetical protein